MSAVNDVVRLNFQDNIAVVVMEDKASKNTFSSQLIAGLIQAFENINHNPNLKSVVIHGYENYFCCGGTKEELLELSRGDKNFSDFGFYRLLLDCPIPVISAMQGHALGGGLAFGTFADILVMAEEAFYATNFMNYGFTPGFGSTYFIPKKFGIALAEDMLFRGQNYQGRHLKECGLAIHFAPRVKVIEVAMELAQEISKSPHESIIALKQQLTREDILLLPRYIEQEIAMHKISFQLPEVRARINQHFL